MKISAVRHGSLMLEAGGRVIHVDPWSQGNYEGLPKAVVILITIGAVVLITELIGISYRRRRRRQRQEREELKRYRGS